MPFKTTIVVVHPQPELSTYDRAGIIAELTQVSDEIVEGFERMKVEPDLERRRKIGTEFGPAIGRYINVVGRSVEADSEDSRPFMRWATDHMLSDTIRHWLWLMQYELIDGDDDIE